jgi:hypothetical protein
MWLRSLGVIVFITIVGATGIYFARRPTVARGAVIADELVRVNDSVKEMTCDDRIPIGLDGATFHCGVVFKNGQSVRVKFAYDREGRITQAQETDLPPVKKTSDPWGD